MVYGLRKIKIANIATLCASHVAMLMAEYGTTPAALGEGWQGLSF